MAPCLPPMPPLPVLRNLMAQWSVFLTAIPSKSCTTNVLNVSVSAASTALRRVKHSGSEPASRL